MAKRQKTQDRKTGERKYERRPIAFASRFFNNSESELRPKRIGAFSGSMGGGTF